LYQLSNYCSTIKSGFTYTEHNSIFGLEGIWDSILNDNHCLNSSELKILELAKPADLRFRYLLLHQNNILCGVIYLQHLQLSSNYFDGTILNKPGLGWLKKFVNKQFEEILICGNLFRIHMPGYFMVNGGNDSEVFQILDHYFKHNKDRSNFCGIILKDCPHELNNTRPFKAFNDDITMELDINPVWNSFKDYQNSLSKKYRQRCAKIQKSGDPLVLKSLTLDEMQENAPQIEKLYLNVALKQSLRIGLVNAEYFIEMKRKYQHNFDFRAYFLDGKMVAFSTHIFYPNNTMEIHFIGLDYEYNLSYCLYFNILFSAVEVAIEKKVTKLELGRTARTAKASLGAKSLKVHNYLYLKRGIPSLAFSFFNYWFGKQMGDDWQERQPFK